MAENKEKTMLKIYKKREKCICVEAIAIYINPVVSKDTNHEK